MKKVREVKGDAEIAEVSWRDQERQLAREESVRQQKLSNTDSVVTAYLAVFSVSAFCLILNIWLQSTILAYVGLLACPATAFWFAYALFMAFKHR